jgi:hypothetical protein
MYEIKFKDGKCKNPRHPHSSQELRCWAAIDLTGYKWRIERKRRLLAKELAAVGNQPGVTDR